ncbi:MFS transporter [uncultured Sanguibacteroides sp.]|uniref:MFS transporter n=1 Tax=uncultured Sanguibacteroides sp. TaxID=1635151 RepID=UPI0025E4E99F|nr:MFS transporter [uncultured Sanguibacteroides sp.]
MSKNKNWLSLFITNYLGVLNDNFLKTLACFICIAWVGKEYESMIVTLASAALVIPYLLFSPLAGRLAKIYKKRKIVVWAKFAELWIMVVAGIGLLTTSTSVVLIAILLMGLQSALFSPSKYGLIRDIGGEEGISFGSGAMEMFAFVGILSGTLLAAFLSESVSILGLCGLLFLVALLGWIGSLTIRARESEPLKESHETLNPVKFVRDMYIRAKDFKGLNLIIIGLAVFWFIGSMIQMTLIVYCRGELGMSDSETGMVMSLAAVGIGAGCYLAGVFSHREVELGLVPWGGIMTGIAFAIIFLFNLQGIAFALLVFLAAFCSGMYKVPLDAWIQANVKGRELGDMLAYSNLITFLFMLFASGCFGTMEMLWDTKYIFLFLAILTFFMTFVLYKRVKEVRERFKSLKIRK